MNMAGLIPLAIYRVHGPHSFAKASYRTYGSFPCDALAQAPGRIVPP